MKKIYTLLCLALLCIFVLTGCTSETASEDKAEQKTVTVTDAAGRSVTLKQPIRSYAISTFDLIDFIVPLKGEEAFAMLKGVGDSGGKKSYDKVYEPRFPQYKDQWKIISPHNAPFDVEAILTAKPDVLIVNSAMQGHMHAMDIEPRLTEAGIALLLVDVPGTSPQSAQDLYRLLGEVFGEPEKASEVASFLDQQYADLQAGLAKVSGPKPLVYYEKSGSAEIFGPSSRSNVSGWGTLITRAGGENLADRAGAGKPVNGPPGSVSLDPEYILTSDPDFIFLSGTSPMGLGAPPEESIKDRFSIVNRPGWDRLKAVKNKNVYEYQHELARTTCVFYPTLSFAKLFYPEAFANIDPEARLAEFYDRFMLIKSSDGLWKMRLP